MKSKGLRVLGFQLKVDLDCDEYQEYLISNDELYCQLEDVKKVLLEKDADVILFPEMCYIEEMDDYYKELSNHRIVVAGSVYIDGINYTIVYQDGEKKRIRKYNSSGAEPMIRNVESVDTNTFLKKHLGEHTFVIKGKKIIILNCMEYYQHAYRIARDVPDIFGIVCICSNSNQKVFLEETMALNNHMETVYSFVLNCVSNYMGREYAKGESYVFGPISRHEQDWLKIEGKDIYDHNSAILHLGCDPEYFYGEFDNSFSRFGRSDRYQNNPRNLEIGFLRKVDE